MIVTVLMPFYKSADTLSRFRGHPFTIPRISSALPRKTADFIKFLVTSTVGMFARVCVCSFAYSTFVLSLGEIPKSHNTEMYSVPCTIGHVYRMLYRKLMHCVTYIVTTTIE